MHIPEEMSEAIRNSRGEALFTAIEQYFSFNFNNNSTNLIPQKLKNIVILQGCDSAVILSKLNNGWMHDLEHFMQTTFEKHMIGCDNEVVDFLGIFKNGQAKFKFLVGEQVILRMISKICKAATRKTETDLEQEDEQEDEEEDEDEVEAI